MRGLFSLFFLLVLTSVWGQQNTILIIADDVSPDYFGCFSTNTDTANAPNIAAMAARGVRFTHVWSAPVCSPARSQILTGRYPFRTGVGGVITNISSPQIDTAEVSIAKILKYGTSNSFQTACVGKWHLTANAPARRLNPNKLGFDLYSGNFNGAIPNYYQYVRVKNGMVDTITTYATTQTVNDAISWLDTISPSQPFFLWLAFNAPHDPFHVPPANLCNTTGLLGTPADINANPKKYFKAAIQAMDSELGRLFAYLASHQLLDSTNIVFIGDNGNQSQVAQNAVPSKSKGTIYDYGVRVPMIVAGPVVVQGNRNCHDLVSTVDLFATMAEWSRVSNWKSYIPSNKVVDSRSFLPVLKNQSNTQRSWIFSETFNTPSTSADGKSIRNADYHLLRFDQGGSEFYHTSTDLQELSNLLSSPSNMTSQDILNYRSLCDTLASLTGLNSCLPLGIPEPFNDEAWALRPNPSNGNFSIVNQNNSLLNSYEVIIRNQKGQLVFQKYDVTGPIELDLKNQADGFYSVELIQNKKRSTKVLIKGVDR